MKTPKKRAEAIRLEIQPDNNIRAIRMNDPKLGSASEWCCQWVGGVIDCITVAHVPKIVDYVYECESDGGERASVHACP